MTATTVLDPRAAVAELADAHGLAAVLEAVERLLDSAAADAMLCRRPQRFGCLSTAAYLTGMAADHVRRAESLDTLPETQREGGGS